MSKSPVSKFTISTKDIAQVIMKKYSLHEGYYILAPEINANIGPHRVLNSEEAETHIGITLITTGYSLMPAPADTSKEIIFDASELNPKKQRATRKPKI